MVIQTVEPVYTMKATESLVRILDSIYAKPDLEQVAVNETHLNSEERTQLLSLLQYFEDLFGVTIVEWDRDPVDLELKPYYKPFHCKYYLLPIINKGNFCRELEHLVKIGLITLVQRSQYGTTIFIIPE